MDKYNVEISTDNLLKLIYFSIIIFLIYQLRVVFIILLISFIISSGIILFSRKISDKLNINYLFSLTLVFSFILFVLSLILIIFVPTLVSEINAFIKNIPIITSNFEKFIEDISLGSFGNNFDISGNGIKLDLPKYSTDFINSIILTSKEISLVIFNTLVILVLTFYISINFKSFDDIFTFFSPYKYQKKIRNNIEKARTKVGEWLVGKMITSSLMGISFYIILLIFGIPYAILFGLMVAIFDIIPYIGPLIAVFPVIIIAFSISIQLGLIIIIAYIILQNIQSNVYEPLIIGKATGLSPIVIFVSILLGASIFGAVGAIIAVPSVSIISIFIEDLKAE